MGNSSSEAKICEQPLDVLVEDALATLKERPGATEADIFKFLEKKYRTRISSSMKKTVGLRMKAALQRPSCRGSGRWTGSSTRGEFESNHSRQDRHKFSSLADSSHSRGRCQEDEDSEPESAGFGTQEDNDTTLDSKDCYSIQGHCQNHPECRRCYCMS
ncbi:hypothetical protein CY35_04G113700 [Sphagnum magellanicum]|nr:hypothetical protein CY35_04G113700 [Sphagnum magellanicum]